MGGEALTGPYPVMDDGWEIKKARSRVISAGNSASLGSLERLSDALLTTSPRRAAGVKR